MFLKVWYQIKGNLYLINGPIKIGKRKYYERLNWVFQNNGSCELSSEQKSKNILYFKYIFKPAFQNS